jgi:hypothetical protein
LTSGVIGKSAEKPSSGELTTAAQETTGNRSKTNKLEHRIEDNSFP